MPAEEVASQAVSETREYLDSDVAIASHLADQLLLPMTQSGGGRFYTSQPSTHFATNAEIIDRFFDLDLAMFQMERGVMIDFRPR